MVARRGVLVVVWGFVACVAANHPRPAVIDDVSLSGVAFGSLTVRWVWAARRWGLGLVGCGPLPTRWPSGSSSGNWSSSACCASRLFAVCAVHCIAPRVSSVLRRGQCGFKTDGCVIWSGHTTRPSNISWRRRAGPCRLPLPGLYPPRARAPCERAAAASAPASPGPPTINPS